MSETKHSVAELLRRIAILDSFRNADYNYTFGDRLQAEQDVQAIAGRVKARILYFAMKSLAA